MTDERIVCDDQTWRLPSGLTVRIVPGGFLALWVGEATDGTLYAFTSTELREGELIGGPSTIAELDARWAKIVGLVRAKAKTEWRAYGRLTAD